MPFPPKKPPDPAFRLPLHISMSAAGRPPAVNAVLRTIYQNLRRQQPHRQPHPQKARNGISQQHIFVSHLSIRRYAII